MGPITETNELLSPYIPRVVVAWLQETPDLAFQEVEGTVAFVDISGFTNLSERQVFPPYGLFGGEPGRLARTVINPGPGEEIVHGKQSRGFADGDVVSFQQSGAGGYGDPLERDPLRVLEDVVDDYVSVDAARERYGVVLVTRRPALGDDGTWMPLAVDEAATRALRAARRSADGGA